MNKIYSKYKTNIQVSREVQRLLKNLKRDNETYNDILERLLKEEGYL